MIVLAALLVWVGTPIALAWAVFTLRRRASLLQGLSKLAIGVVIACLLLYEWDGSLPSLTLFAMAVITAVLGAIDVTVVRIQLADDTREVEN